MKLWIARDKDGSLWLYNAKPDKNSIMFTSVLLSNEEWSEEYPLDDNLFPEVTFENSPREVEIKLI